MTSRPCEAAQVTAQNMPRVCASLPMLAAQSASNTFATLFRICGGLLRFDEQRVTRDRTQTMSTLLDDDRCAPGWYRDRRNPEA